MDKQTLLAEMRSAKDAVTKAEEALANLLSELQGGARAQKTRISKTLETAFETLHAARQQLVALETRTMADDD